MIETSTNAINQQDRIPVGLGNKRSKMSENEAKIDPRVKRTRRMLQEALNELLAEKKFTEITVQDIAARAEVNRATFYAHFVDKYDLINSIIRENFQAALNKHLPDTPEFTSRNLHRLIDAVYTYLSDFPGRCNNSHLHAGERLMAQQVQLQLYAVLLDWLKHSPMGTTADPTTLDVTAMITSWAIFGPILQLSWDRKALNRHQLNQITILEQTILKAYLVEDEALSH